jgi:hypothetical protein
LFQKRRGKNYKQATETRRNCLEVTAGLKAERINMRRLETIRQIGAVEQICYRWHKQFDGMGVDQLREPKRLQKESVRKRQAMSN